MIILGTEVAYDDFALLHIVPKREARISTLTKHPHRPREAMQIHVQAGVETRPELRVGFRKNSLFG